MANKNSRAKADEARDPNSDNHKLHFSGRACITDFKAKERNSMNKRKSAWEGAKPAKKAKGQAVAQDKEGAG